MIGADGIVAVVQARMGSSRLPGKVLAPVLSEPMILRQLERVGRARTLDRIVVATSDEPADDELVAVLEGVVEVHRGPLLDVQARFAQVVATLSAAGAAPRHLVRLTADCPLADPGVIDAVVSEHIHSGADYTSNALERTFPRGLDAEVFSVAAFERLLALPSDEPDREHVTPGFYRRPDEFVLASVRQAVDRSGWRWTVDTPEDLEFVRAVYAELYDENPAFGQDDVVALLERHPALIHLEP